MRKLAPQPAVSLPAGDPPAAGDAAVTITAGIGGALATVMVRRQRTDLLVERVRDAFGLAPPLTPRRIVAGATAFAWAGPGHWLAMAEDTEGPAFEARLRAVLADVASVSDQSDGRVVFRVGGPHAPDTLAKGLPIDLHPRAFAPGDTAVTMVSHMATHIWQVDAAPTYELAVSRSFAASFSRWLLAAAAEFAGS
ncbi:MAG: sarcosine oxidase subunit gamma family protein [Xanthobacteraceae bacterium]|jgi:sarcosine oxidase subunit gamma